MAVAFDETADTPTVISGTITPLTNNAVIFSSYFGYLFDPSAPSALSPMVSDWSVHYGGVPALLTLAGGTQGPISPAALTTVGWSGITGGQFNAPAQINCVLKPAAGQSIAKDNTNTFSTSSFNSSFSYSLTISGSNRILVFSVGVEVNAVATATVASVKIGSTSFTLAKRATQTGTNEVGFEVWYLINPPTGSQTVVCTVNNAVSGSTAVSGMTSYTGVDQVTGIEVAAEVAYTQGADYYQTPAAPITLSQSIDPRLSNTQLVALIAGIKVGTAASPSSVTFAGQSMSLLLSVPNGTHRLDAWGLTAPPGKTGDIVATWVSYPTSVIIDAISFSGVNQATAIEATHSSSNNVGSAISDTITTLTDNAWVLNFANSNGGATRTANGSMVKRVQLADQINLTPRQTSLIGTTGPVLPAAATTSSWATNSTLWESISMSLKSATSSTSFFPLIGVG